jgi:acetolactate synthase-1/3 small subunit
MKHTMVAWMEDKPGVLNRVASLFRRRNFNIESLAVGHTETPGISRMTFVVDGDERELALVKVCATSANRAEIVQLAEIYRANVVDVDMDSLVIQVTGPEDRVDSLIKLLEHFGIQEMVRTGRVAMVRGNGHNMEPAHNGIS